MASKGEASTSTQKVISSAGRFVYDVLLFTLPKCGYPETMLPTTDVKENDYGRPHFIKIAGVSALRVALIMRDKWRRMFESRLKTSGLDDQNLPIFMMNIMRCCPLSRRSTMQTMVEISLALSNEIILFFHSQNIEFNGTTIIGSVGFTIANLVGSDKNWLEMLVSLFDKFDNIGEYSRWITNFIEKFTIPYGSRSDVSELFFQQVKERHFAEIKRIHDEPEEPSLKDLKDRLGFLPHDLFSTIVAEESESQPENWMLGSGSTLPGDRDSPDLAKCPFLQKGAIEKGEAHSHQSTRSEEPGFASSTSGHALPIEPSSPQESSESGGVKKKPRQRRTTGSKKTSATFASSLQNIEATSGPVSPNEPPKSHASPGSSGVAEKKSEKGQGAKSRKTSRQTTQGQPSSIASSELGIEDELKRMNLGPAEVSQKGKGATPKRKGRKK